MASRPAGRLASLFVLLTAGCATVPPDAVPADPAAARIDALLAPRIATREANGTVLVFRNGIPVYRRDIGMADFAERRPIDERTLFRLASVSKTFTGGAAMSLRAEERLRFPAPLSDYLPDFPRANEIRVFHLLAHSSGLGDVPQPADGGRHASIEQTVRAIGATPLAFAPGTSSSYSNAGYVLAARLIEVAAGASYDQVLRARFFEPLGMASAAEDVAPAPRRRTHFYYPGPGDSGVVEAEPVDLSGAVGAGALMMTADDLMLWLEAVRMRRFFDLWAAEYPFGWGRRTWFGQDAVEQSGRNAGYSTSVAIIPGEGLSVLCLFNTQSGFGLKCAPAVAAALLDREPPVPLLRLDLPRAAPDAMAVQGLVGSYDSGRGWRLEIGEDFGRLRYRFAERWQPLTPTSGDRYLLLPDSAMATARRDGAGRVSELAYSDGGEELVLRRSAQ